MGHIRQERCLVRGDSGVGRGNPASRRRGSCSSIAPSLGGQRVIVTFTAFALAAKHKRSGQEQEGGGHQEQEPKSSEDAHDLQGDGQRVSLRALV